MAQKKKLKLFRLKLPSEMLQRGFWLYVWRVVAPDDRELLYVGRTGDNSSPNASPIYIRMGQHLGSVKSQNALRRHLLKLGMQPEQCQSFELKAVGPVHPEVAKPIGFSHSDRAAVSSLMKLHLPLRDIVGAMEKRLEQDLRQAGYDVMNIVKSKYHVDDVDWSPIRRAFARDFPRLDRLS